MANLDLRLRTRRFANRIINLVTSLPNDRIGDVLGRQVLKSGTSIGANYREALRASSKRHFITILEIAQREADETIYWLEIIGDAHVVAPSRLASLTKESNELLAILTKSILTAKRQK